MMAVLTEGKLMPAVYSDAPGVVDPPWAMWYSAMSECVLPPPNEVSNLMTGDPS